MIASPSTPSPAGHPAYTQPLPCAAPSAAEARRLVRTALGVWGLDALADEAELVVSELVGNAVRHTRCRLIQVSVARPARGTVRVAVADGSYVRPVPRAQPGDEDVCGRGLVLVAALADRWGTDPLPCGKRVWAELAQIGGAR
ncbi:ATP-binding protein [Actinacidiphila sp. ITFR-21]|uniref:ATP-binding protein n=1 Tax=Actinacidiphila sp. ITFR-21 TaxID=3075199 RepID=UPI00288BC0AC|nr:ATP-binding protein [Streptomyces sp. ITFR-21]WNI17245.1 ATP-binding protein [Streptomyces sp. ITFR-21]